MHPYARIRADEEAWQTYLRSPKQVERVLTCANTSGQGVTQVHGEPCKGWREKSRGRCAALRSVMSQGGLRDMRVPAADSEHPPL